MMKNRNDQRLGSLPRQGCLIGRMLLLLGGLTLLNPSHAQSLNGLNPNMDSKAVKSIDQASTTPDHTTLWNEDDANDQNWMFHFQNTDIIQGNPPFHSPYVGLNSLPAGGNAAETVSIDLMVGAHLWPGGELYFDAEPYQGYGLGTTHGIADFPNGEAFKAGTSTGNIILPRLFYRQTFGFGGEQEQLPSGETQLAQKADISRLTLTFGKFSVGDLFDNNTYTHDQRSQFMGWTFVDSGGFDFAQDADGFTEGVALDFNQKNWALIWGHFLVPAIKNTHVMDFDLTKAWEEILELDERFTIKGHPGNVRLIGWLLSAHIGSFWNTVNDPAAGEDITQTAQYRKQFGFAVSADQEITKDLGVFTRISWGQPNDDTYLFTDMSESLAIGGQLAGTMWSRPDDTVGFGDTIGALSQAQSTYYNNGGLGAVIGDGQISYGPENVTEIYYNAQLAPHVNLTGDFQLAVDPGFNSARGPVPIFGARLHFEY
jgi:high affinity Mn2+ porin